MNNTYECTVNRYFGGTETFHVVAETKTEALNKAKLHPVVICSGGNVDMKTLTVTKLQN